MAVFRSSGFNNKMNNRFKFSSAKFGGLTVGSPRRTYRSSYSGAHRSSNGDDPSLSNLMHYISKRYPEAYKDPYLRKNIVKFIK